VRHSRSVNVVFFDGVCHLCQATVRFIIARDAKASFHFASLQSAVARDKLGAWHGPDSVVLLEGDRVSIESTAALRIARKLRFPWSMAYAFIIVPRPLRDVVYRFIAKRRYRWFGKDDACWLPTPELRKRFLDS
jgi:prepilin-type processing-associated H-X9-DG protein